jgi:hypothetical protein
VRDPNTTQAQTQAPKNPNIRTVPALLQNEIVAALISLAVLCVISGLFDAPIEGPADPRGIPGDHVKAPWIFVGIQQLLKWLPPFIAGVLIPVAVMAALPVIPYTSPERGRVPLAVKLLFVGLLAASCVLTLWGYLS